MQYSTGGHKDQFLSISKTEYYRNVMIPLKNLNTILYRGLRLTHKIVRSGVGPHFLELWLIKDDKAIKSPKK